jgi:hypothetical protein
MILREGKTPRGESTVIKYLTRRIRAIDLRPGSPGAATAITGRTEAMT